MQMLMNLLKPEWWRFEWRYWRRKTPWDTQITPPEVMAFADQASPGRALDLGCGTGTNAITLARRNWRVTAIDFSPKAIRTARRKAAAAGVNIDFQVGDVSELGALTGPYDYALDIGCLLSLKPQAQKNYARGLSRLLSSGGRYMLYAWLPRPWRGSIWGITPEDVKRLLAPTFSQNDMALGQEKGAPSAWYWFTRN
jgi:2-polyprenyl-3-methyl-5-hydroxy-6-metoxy-1,4-benzoquinol methylase